MSKSNYLENKVLDAIFGQTALPAIGTIYVALFTAAPSDTGGGTEVSGSNYARAAVTNNTTNFPNASGGSKSNANAINFNTPSGSWGTLTHFALFDALTVGNMLYWGALNQSIAAGLNNTVTIAAGQLTISED